MDAASEQAAGDLLKQEVTFAYAFFQATEFEARTMERYVLIAVGAMYSYLATTKQIPLPYPQLAWYAPTLVTVIASIRTEKGDKSNY